MVYARVAEDGTVKSSVDKFYSQEVLQQMARKMDAAPGDLILILSGDDTMRTRKQLCELRLEMGRQLGLRDKDKFACLWVVDFPMFEWSDEEQRLMAMHHPFTHPKDEDIPMLDTDPAAVRADAYDMVINGVEVGGGSIRIHDAALQAKMFEILGFTPEKAQEQFGFLMNAFKFGAPPHGGLAYGLDRWVSLFAGLDSIRDCIAFPKNNSGRDVMLDAPPHSTKSSSTSLTSKSICPRNEPPQAITKRQIIDAVNGFAPLSLQESWDNSGVQVGDIDSACTGVLLCVDCTPVIIDEAIARGCNLVISHHPLLFRGLKHICPGNSLVEDTVIRAITAGISVFASHTALDSARGGISWHIADRWESVLSPGHTEGTGLGVVARFAQPLSCTELAARIKRHIRLARSALLSTHTPAHIAYRICGGSGGEFIPAAISAGCQAYLCSDTRYHDFVDYGKRIFLTDIGHFESEECAKQIFIT